MSTPTSPIKAVRSAETGCVVYIDASAIPAGVKHGAADCKCVKIHGPEELEYIQNSIRVFLTTGNESSTSLSSPSESNNSRVFGAKPSVEVAHMLLGITPVGGAAAGNPAGADSDNKWKKEGGKTWWSTIFGGK
ncbi:hypothetical protein PG996_012041 [Apiospora saccharicola]|uniref:Uncharacterized protein n=1 Tax=Apiospora saccharicola TaxID=335842 RepID=A0ABR1U1G1_9PEZI